ncbi:MAG: radical SAM protein [Candidatus Hadarchaeales archaeon]
MRPRFVDWAITSKCNLRCSHCLAERGEELPREQLLALAGEVKELGPDWVILEGGEPLLREDLSLLLRELEGLDLYLITNGSMLRGEVARELGRRGVKVLFSMDGASKEVYEGTKGGASFRDFCKGVEEARREGIFHGVTVVLSKRNFHQMEETIKFVEEHGGKFVTFIPLQPRNGGNDPYYRTHGLSPQDHLLAMHRIYEREWKVEVYYDAPFLWAFSEREGVPLPEGRSGITIPEVRGCACGTTLYVTFDGRILPCMFFPTSFPFSRYPERSLKEGWERVRNSELIRGFKDRGKREAPCSSCFHFEECFGCMSRVLRVQGRLSASDPECPFRGRSA